MKAEEIVEQIMTQHWDLATCNCWVCKEGRKLGLRPREECLRDKKEEVKTEKEE